MRVPPTSSLHSVIGHGPIILLQIRHFLNSKSNPERKHQIIAKHMGETTKKLSDFVGEVEIAWRGQIERVCFPLRLDIEYLRESTKHRFYMESDLSTQETRMQAAMAAVRVYMRTSALAGGVRVEGDEWR